MTDMVSGDRLEVREVTKSFRETRALAAVSLIVEPAERFCLLGPSGCGKTTLLGVICGLLDPDEGTVRLGGRDITRVPMQERNIGVVFQSYALFPHLTAAANVGFGLAVRHRSRTDTARRVDELLALVRLREKADRYPRQLSGGEQQRVAIARALAIEPSLLLLDEPFSNLDASLRLELQSELRRVQTSAGVTTVLVTHDQSEAFALGDRVGLMSAGELVQVGTPQQLYTQPNGEFTATFVGESNLLRGKPIVIDGQPRLVCNGQLIPLPHEPRAAPVVAVMIRPEHARLVSDASDAGFKIRGTVREATYRGLGWRYVVTTAVGDLLIFETGSLSRGNRGDSVWVAWDVADAVILPQAGA